MDNRVYYYLKSLQHEKVDVKVIIPSNEYEEGIHEGISFVKIKIPRYLIANTIINLFFILKLSRKIGREYNLLYTNAKENILINTIINGLKNTKCKIVLEINENPYSFKVSRLDFNKIRKINRLIFFYYTIRRINGIITITESLSNLIKEYTFDKIRILIIPVLTEINSEYKRNVNNKIPFILHAGSFSESKDGIKAMMKAFLEVHNQLQGNIQFIFTYSSSLPGLKIWFENFIRDNNLNNSVSILGIVSDEELNKLYEECSLAIVNKPLNNQNAYNFPTKISSLVTRRIPLIVSNTGVLSNHFIDGFNSYVVEPDNYLQISKSIFKIISDKKFSEQLADNAYKLAEIDFNYLNHSKKIKHFFEIIHNDK